MLRLRSRIAPAFALAALAVFAAASPAFAQSDTGEIVITVTDAGSNLPVADARTILVGPQTASSLTTKAGVIHYTDVPIGIYRVRVVKSGYLPGVSQEFDVLPNRSLAVNVALGIQTNGLKVVGRVSAKSTVTINASDLSENSPIRRLSDSLTDALNNIAGVSVTQDATDPNSPVTVSLNGHDESQTSVSLDGIPLAAPGATANLRQIGTDLFSGSSVSTSPSAGALGGGVNFRTLQPTQALQIKLSGTEGTFDRANESFAATGSIGSLGIAVQHTDRTSNSPLTFRDYLDQSGLDYAHAGESQSLGDFVKFRYRLNDERTSVSGTALLNNQHNYNICAQDVTILPCGSGPGNENFSRFGFAYGTVQSLVGTVATQFTAFESSGATNTDFANRYALLPNPGNDPNAADLCSDAFGGAGFGGGPPVYTPLPPGDYQETPCPSLSNGNSLTRGVSTSATISSGRHTLTFTGSLYTSSNTSLPRAGSVFETAFTNAVTSSNYQISDSIKSSDKLTLQPRFSAVTTTGLGLSALLGFGATYRPDAADTFGGSVNVGSSQPNINNNRSYSDPVGARYDCQAGTAVVSGPGDTEGGKQSAVSFDANYSHQFVKSGAQVNVDAYSQVQTGQLINASIEEPSSYFPAGYLQTLYNVYQSPAICGALAAVPAVFVNESIGNTRRLYQGVTASGRVGIGRYFVMLPNYTINVAELTAASGRLDDGPSTTIVGEQLPNRPQHRAGLTLDGYIPRSGIELLATAQYTGANNQQNLGPYTTLAAGISHGFGPGVVTLFENNVFNTYGGVFATDAFDRPLPLSDGTSYRTIAQPLTPRTISMSYTMSIGGPKPGPAFASVASRSIAQAPAPQPSGGPDGPPRGQRLVAVPPPAGVDPLSLATTRDSCTADAQPAATPVLAELKSYVTAYEAKTALPDLTYFQIVSHATPAGSAIAYYLELRPKFGRAPGAPGQNGAQGGTGGGRRGGGFGGPPGGGPGGGGPPGGMGGPGDGGPPPDTINVAPRAPDANASPNPQRSPSPIARGFRAFIGCSYVSVLGSSDAKAKGIDVSSGRPGLLYVPGTGLVFLRPPELPAGGGSLKATN